MPSLSPLQFTLRSKRDCFLDAEAVLEPLVVDSEQTVGSLYLPQVLQVAVNAEWKRRQFESRLAEVLCLPLLSSDSAVRVVCLVGRGDKNVFSNSACRLIGARVYRSLQSLRISRLTVHPDFLAQMEDSVVGLQAFAEGMRLASYRFILFKNNNKSESKHSILEEVIVPYSGSAMKRRFERALQRAEIFSTATATARDLVNTPSMDMHPKRLMEIARDLAVSGSGIRCRVYDRAEMERLGMHASLSVAQGSQHEPFFVHLSYRPPRSVKSRKKIALIGKAITFDSGGLNLKPGESMNDMKIDMAGSATVLGLFQALPQLQPPVEIHGLFIAAENMPGGSAYRPGDVVRVYDGTTVEVGNTDAEGRLTLADALSYTAKRIKPDAMVDLATLTGAVIIALGSDVTGVLGTDSKLITALRTAAEDAGEYVWQLPMHASYRDLLKSKIADIKNVGGRPAGAITAAQFLERFTQRVPWAHLDIAGPCYAERETRPDLPVGGTGWGVRTLLRYIEQL